jgi:hypothetical protein
MHRASQRGALLAFLKLPCREAPWWQRQNGTRATGPSRPGVGTGVMGLIGKARAGTLRLPCRSSLGRAGRESGWCVRPSNRDTSEPPPSIRRITLDPATPRNGQLLDSHAIVSAHRLRPQRGDVLKSRSREGPRGWARRPVVLRDNQGSAFTVLWRMGNRTLKAGGILNFCAVWRVDLSRRWVSAAKV